MLHHAKALAFLLLLLAQFFRIAPDPRVSALWASPTFPDTFGKLISLLEVSDTRGLL